ncbi:MAG: hypothetical protein WC175_06625 [Candidatus Dojkabacteria bacterium]
MKKIKKSMPTTSFHGVTITATPEDLIKVLGEPSSICLDQDVKVQYEWLMETKNGIPFTVYDWKEYHEIIPDSEIRWHIGTEHEFQSNVVFSELFDALSDLYPNHDEFEENPTWDDDEPEYLDTPCDHCVAPDSSCDSCPYNNGYDY